VSSRAFAGLLALCVTSAGWDALAQSETRVSLDDALGAAKLAAPDLIVARAKERVAHAEIGVASTYPNPTAIVATNTQTARFSGTLSVPLVVLGQRGAAIDAAQADEVTTTLDTVVTWSDVRQATRHAYVALWLAEGVAAARRDSAAIAAKLEGAVVERVQVGSAPEIDSLRVHAERLKADADVMAASAQMIAAATELGRWMGKPDDEGLRAAAPAVMPDAAPTLASLLARLDGSAQVRREQSDVKASEARVTRERALIRPNFQLDLGADVGDPTLNNQTNYRAQLAFDLPLFNQRGAYVDRETAAGDVARARVQAARVQGIAELTAAYRTYEAATTQQRTLVDAVVPASQGAARATEDAYALGRAQLVAVLDAERTLVDVRLAALDAEAARATAWADIEHAVGAP
jgi:cobalt-zinc-cadmium efflux system outer membrane protein